MLPAFSQDVFTLPDATRYWIHVRVEFDPEQQEATLEGTARLRFRNTEAEALEDVVLMLWPNDGQYRSSMSVGPALVDGHTLEGKEELSGIAIRFQLPEPAMPMAWVDLTVPFLVEAEGPIGEAMPRRFGITRGVLVAPTFYPLLPRRSDGAWQVEPAPYGGDTTSSAVAFYQVRFDVPDDLVLAASGVEVERGTPLDGRVEAWYVSGPMRDFAFALGPFARLEQTAAGTRVRGLVLPEHKGDLPSMVGAAARQVELLSEIVGPYPYAELDLVDAPGAFGGIEYPGLVFIGTLGTPNVTGTTVHEVAHQWFYGVVGNDQIREPWLDEAAATYGDILYQEHVYGSGRSTGTISYYRSLVRELAAPDTPIGWPVGEYRSVSEYALIVYVKGALFFDVLRAAMGEDEFLGFLKDYYQTYRYGFVSTTEFQNLAEEHCGCALTTLFDLWVFQGGEIPGQ
jgi:aminopeptidase N